MLIALCESPYDSNMEHCAKASVQALSDDSFWDSFRKTLGKIKMAQQCFEQCELETGYKINEKQKRAIFFPANCTIQLGKECGHEEQKCLIWSLLLTRQMLKARKLGCRGLQLAQESFAYRITAVKSSHLV